MKDFQLCVKSDNIEEAKSEVLKAYKEFCEDNALVQDISESKSIDELNTICMFMNSLSRMLRKVDITCKQYCYAPYLDKLADALQIHGYALSGIDITSGEKGLLQKLSLEY